MSHSYENQITNATTIDELVFTYNLSKKKILLEKKVIRHYDDNINLKYELKNTNIEFIYVYKDKIILTK